MTHSFTHPQTTEKERSAWFTLRSGSDGCLAILPPRARKRKILFFPPNKNNRLNYNGYVSCSRSAAGRTQLRWHRPLGIWAGVWAGLRGNYRVTSRKDGAEASLHCPVSARRTNVGSLLAPFCFIFTSSGCNWRCTRCKHVFICFKGKFHRSGHFRVA